MKIYDVLILGAGASGLMCAGSLSKKKSLALIEVNEKVAKKLKISGGGKCNITNKKVSNSNFDGSTTHLSYALKRFSRDSLLRFLDRNRVPLELRKDRYYFCQNSAQEIIDVLTQEAKHAEIFLNYKIEKAYKKDDIFEILTDKGIFKAKKLIVATGGKSFSNLGASDIGVKIAESFGLQHKEFSPALVGLTLQKEQFWMKELSGLSCFVKVFVSQKVLYEEMLFAHKGISGPAILSASLYWEKGDISIDFLPNNNVMELIQGSKKLLSSVLPLPKRLAKALLEALKLKDIEVNRMNQEEIKCLKMIHNYTFSPAGNFGFTKAEVSRGGVLCEELKPESLEAKKVDALYFIGEVVDVTGELGGYNFQWAFSSAYICAKAIK